MSKGLFIDRTRLLNNLERLYLSVKSCCTANRGITLIELVVVMVLISLGLAIVGPSVTAGYENLVLQTTGRRVASAFRSSKLEARERQIPIAAVFRPQAVVFLEDGRVLRELSLPAQVRVQSIGSFPTFVFLPTGQVLGPAAVELVNSRGRTTRIVIGPAIGSVRIEEKRL